MSVNKGMINEYHIYININGSYPKHIAFTDLAMFDGLFVVHTDH